MWGKKKKNLHIITLSRFTTLTLPTVWWYLSQYKHDRTKVNSAKERQASVNLPFVAKLAIISLIYNSVLIPTPHTLLVPKKEPCQAFSIFFFTILTFYWIMIYLLPSAFLCRFGWSFCLKHLNSMWWRPAVHGWAPGSAWWCKRLTFP